MKLRRILVLSALLAVSGSFAALAEGITLEVGALGAALNVFGAAQQKPTAATVITSNADLAPDLFVNGFYAIKVDDSTTLRFGLRAEGMAGTASSSFATFGRVEPLADLIYGPLTVRVSFPLYFFGFDTTNDPAYKEIKYIMDYSYKGIYLGTDFASGVSTALVTNYESVAYKLAIDNSTALVFSVSTELGLSPAWIYDLVPQVSLIYGPLQFDLQEPFYFSDQGNTSGPSFSDNTYNFRVYTNPKLTYDFSSLGLKGLKVYFRASLYTYDNFPNGPTSGSAFYGGNSGSAIALGSSLYPGIIYTVGPWYVEAVFKIHNYDDSNTDGLTNQNPTFDPSIRVSYTLHF